MNMQTVGLGLLLGVICPLSSGQDFHQWRERATVQQERLLETFQAIRPKAEQWRQALCSVGGDCAPEAMPTLPNTFGLSKDCFGDVAFLVKSMGEMVQVMGAMGQCSNATVHPTKKSQADCQAYLNGLLLTKYAFVLQQFDANGKKPSGIMEGNVFRFGDYHECLNIRADGINGVTYLGKECYGVYPIATVYTDLFLNPISGFLGAEAQKANATAAPKKNACANVTYLTAAYINYCLPNNCNEDDAKILIKLLNPSKAGQLCDAKCRPRSYDFTTGSIIVMAVLCLFGLLTIVTGILDYLYYTPNQRNKESKPDYEIDDGFCMRFLMSFSLYSNGKRILDTTKRPGQIECLHGIRFLSMSWVIMGHSYSTLPNLIDNFLPLLQLPKYIMNLTIFNATFSVDSFFLMSGCLVSFLWLKKAKASKGKMVRSPYTWVMYYVHRYLRLTPLYAIIVLVWVYLTPYLTRGPQQIDPTNNPFEEVCAKSWWTNLLYINNLVYRKAGEQCYGVAWYLANDMQFYVFAPLFLLMFYFVPIAGVVIGAGLVLTSMGAQAATTAIFYLPAINTFNPWNDPRAEVEAAKIGLTSGDVAWELRYAAPWIRLQPYVLGLILGWLLNSRPKLRMPKWANAIGWLLAAIVALAVLYGAFDTARGIHVEVWVRALYAGVARALWSICLAWVIASCFWGGGGWVNEFLSWAGFIPLSRLTYCAYLLHICVAEWLGLSHDTRMHWNGHAVHLATVYLPMLVGTMLISYFVSAAIELPVANVEALLFAPRRKPKPKTPESSGPSVRTSGTPSIIKTKPASLTSSESDPSPGNSRPTSLAFSTQSEDAPLVMSPLRLTRIATPRAASGDSAWVSPPEATVDPSALARRRQQKF